MLVFVILMLVFVILMLVFVTFSAGMCGYSACVCADVCVIVQMMCSCFLQLRCVTALSVVITHLHIVM